MVCAALWGVGCATLCSPRAVSLAKANCVFDHQRHADRLASQGWACVNCHPPADGMPVELAEHVLDEYQWPEPACQSCHREGLDPVPSAPPSFEALVSRHD